MGERCFACPRNCGVDRRTAKGYCISGEKLRIARVGLHEWEEPCISYGKGSGTVFFSGCNLRCVFCQNHRISHDLAGRDISPETLANELLKLQSMGAVNINLVTPTHYSESIARVLENVKHKLKIPIIYNSGSYDKVETLKMFDGLVDVYLPDIKYYSPLVSKKYSSCEDYFEVAQRAVLEMHRQTGYAVLDAAGHIKKGIVLRHLVLPGLYRDSFAIFDELAQMFEPSKLAVSIMNQYFPAYKAHLYKEINRRVTTLEYDKVVDYALSIGFTRGFTQERTSAKEEYVPPFDY